MKRQVTVMRKLLAFFTALAFFAIILPNGAAAEGPLPKGKTIAVMVRSASTQHARSSESILINSLIQNGYKAVDQKRLASIRQHKAALLALDGNVEAIMQLSQTYGFNVLVSGRATIHTPVKNEFGLYTSTAVVSVTACYGSSGRQIFADTRTAKEIGYTGDEAGQKALETASKAAAQALISGSASPGGGAAATQTYEIEVKGIRTFVDAHGIVDLLADIGCASSGLASFSGGTALVKADWGGSASALAQAVTAKRADIQLERIVGNKIIMQCR
jgi:hypothetical protein